MNSRIRRRAWQVGSLLGLLGGGLWLALGRVESDAVPATGAAAAITAPPKETASAVLQPPPGPTRVASAASVDLRDQLARRMKADWCRVAGAAQLRRLNPDIGPNSMADNRTAAEILEDEVNDALMREAGDQVVQRWIQTLSRRSDPRSQAMADFLSRDEVSRARLQARARSSSDPMLTALALQRPCEPGVCRNIEASQWSRLEPANVLAWAALFIAPRDARRSLQGYVLERMVSEARYSNNYVQEGMALLMSLPQTTTPGFQSAAEYEAFIGIAATWAGPQSFYPLREVCRERLAEPGIADRCVALAELLWREGDVRERNDAIRLVRKALVTRPALRPAWESRAREVEAFSEWEMHFASSRWWQRLVPDAKPVTSACQLLPEQRRMQREFVVHGIWERGHVEMRQSGVSEVELSERRRRAINGRSVLDPGPE